MSKKMKRIFIALSTIALVFSTATTAFATDDPLQVVNNLSEFIFGLIRAIGMILLDIAAPILLMLGLKSATSANASLLGNFEIVATSLIALFLFREKISRRLWIAIALITLSSGILSFEDMSSLHFSGGSLLVLAAAACWGLENNCTRNISDKSTFEIVFLKGIFSGLGSCIIALCIGEPLPKLGAVAAALLLGFVAYGLSIFCYVRAQNALGAAKTSAYYAVAPFIGTALSCIIWRDALSVQYFLALAVMIFGQWKPGKIALAAIFFAIFKSLANIYDSIGWLSALHLTKELYNMMPFAASMVILAFTSKRSRAPKAEGIPYDKGQR